MQPTASLAELLPIQGRVSAEHKRLNCFRVYARTYRANFLRKLYGCCAFQNGVAAVF
jgi:hypothetical protein